MSLIKLNVTAQLANLVPVTGNVYKFIIRYYNQSDVLLSNPELIQNSEVLIQPNSNTFDLSFPISDGTYTINNVKIKLYNNNTNSECVDEFVTNIVVNCNQQGTGCNPQVILTGTPSQACLGASVTINASSIVSTGGTPPYQYALVKANEFINVGSLVWGTNKTWSGSPNTSYRIYTRGTNTDPDSSCYSFISFNTITCEQPNNDCDGGPTLLSITNITPNSLNFTFDAINVTNVIWRIKFNGTVVRNGSSSPTSPLVFINFNTLSNGSYLLEIEGGNCNSDVSSLSFTINETPPEPSNRKIYMNTTGYGFAPDDPTGIDSGWRDRINAFTNLSWNGNTFSGIQGVRLCVRWYDYEPTPGVFRDAEINNAINWLKARNLRISVVYLGSRRSDTGLDTMLTHDEKLWGPPGSAPVTPQTPEGKGLALSSQFECTFTINSASGKAKFINSVNRLEQTLVASGIHDYTALGYGVTEEFYLPVLKNQEQTITQHGTGYGNADQAAWNAWLTAKGHAIIPMQVPPNFSDVFSTGDFWNSGNGRLWYEFITDGLVSLYHDFRDAVHSKGGKACGYFADIGGAQSAWYMTYRLDRLFEGCDYIYSTDGGTRDERYQKLRVIDFVKGSFPLAKPIAEWDPEDVGIYGQYLNNPYGMPLDWNAFYTYVKSCFQRGMDIASLAMAFSDGGGMGNNIAPSAEAMWKLKTECIDYTGTLPAIPEGETIYQPITSYVGNQPFLGEWGNRNGGLNRIIKIDVRTAVAPRFENFSVSGKNGQVWLPKNYSTSKQYSVIYALDGQTLYAKDGFPDGNWNLDNRLQNLIDTNVIKDTIIVSINSGNRMREFLADKPFYAMNSSDQNTISSQNGGGPQANDYLSWLVNNLRPYINSTYSVSTVKEDTVILGSSMGGLFAAYVYGERSDLFGKLASVSTHYPGTLVNQNSSPYSPKVVEYINTFYPNPISGNKLYFDRGTESLDTNYEIPQNQVQSILNNKGYNSSNLKIVVANGAQHTPTDWGNRVDEVLSFLLPK